MEDENVFSAVWRGLRAPEPNLVLRVALSLATGLGFVAAASAAAWAYAHLASDGRVRDSYVGIATVLGGGCWLVTLYLIWRSMRRGRAFVLPAIATIGIVVAVIGGGAAIDELLRVRDEEFLIAAVVLLGGAAIILVWLPTALRLLQGRPVVGADNLVRVHCPRCGYSLIGLRDLRCPECGTEFTIDELIRAQSYSGVPRGSADEEKRVSDPRWRSATKDGEGAGRLESQNGAR